ncbi:MAG: Holliday junction branch migration protein RuvA [Bacteroidetes bacterium]|nr:MAG: Holliday junction branch migration protein RuvA [Bacteroidota bacterium]REK04883.1 MAG: Holliday junction branch migration protein RuvA [Bacteroidota bacterium]REK36355.1 MAG: Holliday junction branch migration protein RuvA [Bacteroidota bacterium]REK50979.1 MAG: Holliday junction branch migration protein RuvA [Bacteroidota bacterium]
MINHLNGRLLEKNPTCLIVECAGVGYFVHISLNTFSKIPDQENIRIYTHLQISEDSHTLYGFADEEERKLFRLLISVSGIGCNTARMMLSSMDVQEIESCILRDDSLQLKNIKGIGEKTAQRVILELKSKLKKEGISSGLPAAPKIKEEAMAALLTLGFNKQTVDKTLDNLLKTSPSADVEDLIKKALKAL